MLERTPSSFAEADTGPHSVTASPGETVDTSKSLAGARQRIAKTALKSWINPQGIHVATAFGWNKDSKLMSERQGVNALTLRDLIQIAEVLINLDSQNHLSPPLPDGFESAAEKVRAEREKSTF